MTSLKLINSKNELVSFLFVITIIFLSNLSYEYYKYSDFKSTKLFSTRAYVENSYFKNDYNIYKFKTKDFDFFTSSSNELKLKKLDLVDISIVTEKITFYDYLKSFYAKSFNIFKIENSNFKKDVANYISNQHKNENLKELFQAIFLAMPVNSTLREIFSIYSVSHLIAISGFHLSVLSFILYFIISFFYNYFHNRYFPYRNKKFDILLMTLSFLFFYLIFTNIVPSLLRSFTMLCFALFLLRSNIKIISFESLVLILLFIIALFPKYIFSLSLWFSIFGVFYIFLFIKYFQNLNKILMILFFNFWIFASFNPIVHYFFGISSFIQLLSPILTLIFTLFYPLELFLHIFGYGDLFDKLLLTVLSFDFKSYEFFTPLWFFIIYLINSIFAIFNKKAFFILNILILGFNILLFIK